MMTVRDLIKMEIDMDVYDDYTEELGVCFCGPMELTEIGKEKFSEVLDYELTLGDGCLIVNVDAGDDDDETERRLAVASEFFEAAAGYCPMSDYDAWFK